jgi:hypothetical protein
MTRRRQGALVAALILLAAGTYIAAASNHPIFVYNAYELETP